MVADGAARRPARPGPRPIPGPDGESRVIWEYRDDGWASVSCMIADNFATVLDIAERVVFTPTVMRVPVRLTWIPDGFRVVAATDDGLRPGPHPGWVLEQEQKNPKGYAAIQVFTMPAETELRPGRRGSRADVIAGHPAVINAEDGNVQLNVGNHRVLLSAVGYPRDRPEWPSGWLALLTRLAERLELAPDLADRATWFDAEQAVPN